MGHRDKSEKRPWEKGGPSPNPKGRPPSKHVKSLFEALDPHAAQMLEFDRQGTGTIGANGEEMTHGSAFTSSILRRAITEETFARMYSDMRREAHDKEQAHKQSVLRAVFFHREQYLDKFILAEKSGKALPNIFPDPRDILIGADGSVRIVGPIDREANERMKKALEIRNIAFVTIAEIMDRTDFEREERREMYLMVRRTVYRINPVLPPRLRRRVPAFHAH